MQEFMIQTLGYSQESYAKFVAKGGDLDELLRWNKDTAPSSSVWQRLERKRDELLKLKAREPFAKWAERWKATDFLRRATRDELLITKSENPFYPCFAYGVSFDACAELATEIKCDPLKRAHAFVCDRIKRVQDNCSHGGAVSSERGVLGSVPLSVVWPEIEAMGVKSPSDVCGALVVNTRSHALHGVDLDATSAAELLSMGAGLDGARVMRKCFNGLCVEGGDTFVRRAPASATEQKTLAQHIRDMLDD